MQTIAIIELVSAVFLAILLIGRGAEFGNSKSSRLLRLCTIMNLVSLVVDAMAYIFMGPETPFAFRYLICIWAFMAGGINTLGFAYYSEAFIAQKTVLKPMVFRIMKIAVLIWIGTIAYLFVTGKLLHFENGVEVANYGFPFYFIVYQMAVLLYMPGVAVIYRKEIGNEAVCLLSFFFITPIIGLIFASLIVDDYSYLFSAISLFFVSEFLQKKQVQEQQAELAAHEALSENSARFFALQDNFVSLYDVEMESGHYISYDRDNFYERNISDKLVSQTEFFTDLRTNVERVVYEEDRESLINVLAVEAIVRGLAEKEHIDHYYRIITENGLMWLKLRIVYKNAGKKSIIVGVFNAEEEMAAKQKEEQIREKLVQINSRLFALEDNFECLYDVDLESGHYEVFVKGDFYQNNVLSKLVMPSDYFEELRSNIDAVVYQEDRDGLFKILTRDAIRSELDKNEHFDHYYRIITDKGPLWFKIRIVYKDAEKKNIIIGVFNAENDIEAEQIAEQKKQLQEALTLAQAANQAKSAFLFNMSHDIRTPMNAIKGFTDIAKKNLDDRARLVDCLDKIDSSGELLLSLINSVLDMSRVESGKAKLEEMAGDISESFSSIETTMQVLAKAKGVSLTFAFGKIEDEHVYADFDRCNRVFVNIISNAIKYSKPNGYVKVFCEQAKPKMDGRAWYRYTFEDNGIGMSEEFVGHIFEEFSRERNSTTSGIQGTGLGMAVVKSFVELMGGTINVQSKQGEGSTFTLVLPFRLQPVDGLGNSVKDSQMSGDGGAQATLDIDFKGRKVLLVEDNELNREIALELLEEAGFIVEGTTDGSQAVEILKAQGPDYYDFVLMDIQMPVMSGYEATKAIRNMYPDAKLPIIALSANAFAEDKAASIAAGMNAHVAKPIKMKELLAVMAKFL